MTDTETSNLNARKHPCTCGHARAAHPIDQDCAAIGCPCADYRAAHKPSPTQAAALSVMGEHRIVRLPGGFWCLDDASLPWNREFVHGDWHIGTQTVRAMERAGYIRPDDGGYVATPLGVEIGKRRDQDA